MGGVAEVLGCCLRDNGGLRGIWDMACKVKSGDRLLDCLGTRESMDGCFLGRKLESDWGAGN